MTNIEDEARMEAEKRWPPNDDPRQWGPALRFIPAGKREAYVAGYVDGHGAASRQREGAPSIEDVVTSVDQLDALPVGSVVLEGEGPPFPIPTVSGVFHRFPREVWSDSDGWFVVAGRGGRKNEDIVLPARVLYAPAPDTKEDQ